MKDTGNQATATFATLAAVSNITGIDAGESTLEDLDTSTLETVGSMTFKPTDLADEGEVTIPFLFNAESALPVKGTIDTLTITYPQAPGQTAPATEAGTGYIKRVRKVNLQNNTLQAAEITFKWDGETGPTFTPATTA